MKNKIYQILKSSETRRIRFAGVVAVYFAFMLFTIWFLVQIENNINSDFFSIIVNIFTGALILLFGVLYLLLIRGLIRNSKYYKHGSLIFDGIFIVSLAMFEPVQREDVEE